jgi:hypothetical protein
MKKISTSFLIVSFLFLFLGKVYAQEIAIKGQVVDENKIPLRGKTEIMYGKKRLISAAGTGAFLLHIKGSAEGFDTNLLQISRSRYTVLSIEFDKPSKQLTITMAANQEQAGILLDEAGKPISGASIIFKAGTYQDKVMSNSAGKFTIHAPKGVELATSNFTINGNALAPQDVAIMPQYNGINVLTLTYRPITEKKGKKGKD